MTTVSEPREQQATGRHSSRLRIIPQWDRNPGLVTQATSREGRMALLGLFGLFFFLCTSFPFWLWTMAVLCGTTFFPQSRRKLISVGALGAAVLAGRANQPAHAPGLYAGSLLVVFAIGTVAYLAAIKWRHARIARRPVLALNLFFVACVFAAAMAPLGKWQAAVQYTVVVLAGYLWYFAYTLQDRSAKDRDGAFRQMGTWAAFWQFGTSAGTPIGKGAAYLRKIEAKSDEELAITQIKGVKLLMWCFALRILTVLVAQATSGAVFGFAVPSMESIIASSRFPAWYVCWESLGVSFVVTVLWMATWGNTIVACCRMAGFRALRNTRGPFASESIAEFWNRYYYYFKELLVDFFFFPTYTRYFKKHRRVRMFAATLAAATFGNLIYHFFRDIDLVFRLGIRHAIFGYRVYALYCMILGCTIGISQQWARTSADRNGLRRAVAIGRVILFFGVLHIFDYSGRDHTIAQHARFLARLFNL